jgi:hypothetical protein
VFEAAQNPEYSWDAIARRFDEAFVPGWREDDDVPAPSIILSCVLKPLWARRGLNSAGHPGCRMDGLAGFRACREPHALSIKGNALGF